MAIGDVTSQARGSGARFNDGKVPLDLIPLSSLTDCARVFGYGRKKYAAWNWAKGMDWSVPYGCALRHLSAWFNGEDNDPESGLPHLGHVMCNLVMLSTFARTFPEGDDRPVRWLNMPADKALGMVEMAPPVIPHDLAAKMQRDGIVPNCDGHHATEAPMPPHLAERLDGRDDDEGEADSDNPDYRAGGTSSDDEVDE